MSEPGLLEFGHLGRIDEPTRIMTGNRRRQPQTQEHVVSLSRHFGHCFNCGNVTVEILPTAAGGVAAELTMLQGQEARRIAQGSNYAAFQIKFPGAVPAFFDHEFAPEI